MAAIEIERWGNYFFLNKPYKGLSEKYFTHAVDYPINDPIFYKDVTPSRGSQFIQTTILPQQVL